MWEMHTALSDTPLDIDALLAENDDASLGRAVFASACYAEHGLPLLLALAARHGEDVEAALLANANIGGDNVHRGMLLGMIAGAGTNSIPDRLKRGLADNASIENEIEGFAEVVLRAGGF
jgi:ADP-ribosylglycohydrolase